MTTFLDLREYRVRIRLPSSRIGEVAIRTNSFTSAVEMAGMMFGKENVMTMPVLDNGNKQTDLTIEGVK